MIYLLKVSSTTSINGITFVTGLPSNGRIVTIINNNDNVHNIQYNNQAAGATGPLWIVNNNTYTCREQGAATFVYFSSGLDVVTSGWVMTSNSG